MRDEQATRDTVGSRQAEACRISYDYHLNHSQRCSGQLNKTASCQRHRIQNVSPVSDLKLAGFQSPLILHGSTFDTQSVSNIFRFVLTRESSIPHCPHTIYAFYGVLLTLRIKNIVRKQIRYCDYHYER